MEQAAATGTGQHMDDPLRDIVQALISQPPRTGAVVRPSSFRDRRDSSLTRCANGFGGLLSQLMIARRLSESLAAERLC